MKDAEGYEARQLAPLEARTPHIPLSKGELGALAKTGAKTM